MYSPPPPPPPEERRASGCFLGGCAFLIIGLIAIVLAVLLVLNEDTGDQLKDQVANVAATEVARIDTFAIEEGGTITVTEEHLNTEIRRYRSQFGPLNNPEIEIRPDALRISFDVLGIGNSYEAGVDVENGEIKLVDVEGSTIAGAILSADDIAEIVEDSLRDLQQRSNVIITDVELGDGVMTIMTIPADGTPVATPAAATPDAATPEADGSPTAVSTVPSSARPSSDLSTSATEAVGGTVVSLPGDGTSTRTPTATSRTSIATSTPTSESLRGNVQQAVRTPTTPSGDGTDLSN